jgi:hypothetical protein
MTFDEAIGHLTRLKVQSYRDYDYGKQGTDTRHKFKVNVFSGFLIPFTAEEWCAIAMRESDHYIGGCCGTTSAAQGYVNAAFQDGGYISGKDLSELADLLAHHDEPVKAFCTFNEPKEPIADLVEKAVKRWKKIDPWSKIALLWHVTKNFIGPEVPRAYGKHMSELEVAMSTVEDLLRYLSFERVFKWGRTGESEELDSQGTAQRAVLMAKLLPALKVVYDQIKILDAGPFEGFALIDKEKGPDAVARNGRGLCLFSTREEVDDLLKLWREQEAQYEEKTERDGKIDDRIGVRRVRVTTEKGLEFLDDGPV